MKNLIKREKMMLSCQSTFSQLSKEEKLYAFFSMIKNMPVPSQIVPKEFVREYSGNLEAIESLAKSKGEADKRIVQGAMGVLSGIVEDKSFITLENIGLDFEDSDDAFDYALGESALLSMSRRFDFENVDNLISLIEEISENDDSAEFDCIKLTILMLKVADLIKDSEDKSTLNGIFQAIVLCILNKYILAIDGYVGVVGNSVNIANEEMARLNREKQYDEDKINSLKSEIKILTKQNKQYEGQINNTSNNSSTNNNLLSMMKKLEDRSDEILSNMTEFKVTASQKAYENQIDNLVVQVSDLRRELHTKTQEIKELREQLSNQVEVRDIEEEFMSFVGENEFSKKIIKFLNSKNYYLTSEQINSIEDEPTSVLTNVDSKDDELLAIRKLGYLSIEDGVHYVTYMDDTKKVLGNVQDRVLLSQNQFVLTNGYDDLLRATFSKYEDNGRSVKHLRMGMVDTVDPLVIKVGNECIEPSIDSNSTLAFKENQVVCLNEENKIVRAFKRATLDADTTKDSLDARGIDMYYLMSVDGDKLSVKNIVSGETFTCSFDTGNVTMMSNTIIFVKKGKVVTALANVRFYVRSTFFSEELIYGPLIIKDSVKYLERNDGELVELRFVPDNIQLNEGSVVAATEDGLFMLKANTDEMFVNKVVTKNVFGRKSLKERDKSDSVEKRGTIVAVGRPSTGETLKAMFVKYGFEVMMLDGYNTSLSDVSFKANRSEGIIVDVSYCSHENSLGIKDNIKDGVIKSIPNVISSSLGPSGFVREFLKSYNQMRNAASSEVAIGKE